jgi:hypothetical protein
MDSEVVLRQEANTISILCESQRLMRKSLDYLLSRKNEEASPAPSTSIAVDIAPTPTTSATLTTGEDFQGASDPGEDWQQIAASLAADRLERFRAAPDSLIPSWRTRSVSWMNFRCFALEFGSLQRKNCVRSSAVWLWECGNGPSIGNRGGKRLRISARTFFAVIGRSKSR